MSRALNKTGGSNISVKNGGLGGGPGGNSGGDCCGGHIESVKNNHLT